MEKGPTLEPLPPAKVLELNHDRKSSYDHGRSLRRQSRDLCIHPGGLSSLPNLRHSRAIKGQRVGVLLTRSCLIIRIQRSVLVDQRSVSSTQSVEPVAMAPEANYCPSQAKPVVSKRQFEKHSSSERPVESEGKPPGPAECICHALVQPLSRLAAARVEPSQWEGLGRLISIPALLSSVQAIDIIRRGVEPTRITLGCMVEALASNDNAEGAYEVIQWALGDPRLKGATRSGDRRDLQLRAEKLESPEMLPSCQLEDLLNLVVLDCCLMEWFGRHATVLLAAGNALPGAEEMIREKVEFSTTTYNALLDVCARSGEISRAEPLLKQMADQGSAGSLKTRAVATPRLT
eukprot:Skav229437  [mRNA]  locus=scaffold397:86134:97585:- [translate_table: standard]